MSTMQVILDQDSFYSWFNQAFLFDSKTMLGVWVSESEMRRLADTMAPQRYPCLAMMIPGSPHVDSPRAVYVYREQIAHWLEQLSGQESCTFAGR
ncbi:hypothetical protein KB20921_13050 [Edwardsiella ictaluri]|nr:hypothetical protein KH20906_12760 [Edwardsiella ictaluri]BEI02044.1 hypothetical protein KB20921_13050 [Edwardsiella ictaluri]BEI05513.1 hypothetical protein KH201010_12990 [Edwardsiella ictaluri]BEI08973.1 hypothetical protein STU22726_13040 [Edwardsiella ictaluri]BEI12450.1 hypothetical protein STU22816_13030 [Edwardsiella ictaluri]